jgi:hypothetical protein
MPLPPMKSVLHLLSTVVALLCVSCGGGSLDYVEASAPTAPYQVAVVKGFGYKVDEPDARGAELSKEFATVLVEEIQNVGKFSKVTTAPQSGRALRIEGDVTYLAEGNSALRIGIGMGAGSAHFSCTGRFIDNSTGKLLGTFEVERSSKSGLRGVADNFPIIRRSAAGDIAEKAAEFTATP